MAAVDDAAAAAVAATPDLASGDPGAAPDPGPAVADDLPALVAVRSDHYAFGAEIARGGMGRVLRARDRRLGRDVAVKELLATSADARRRFEREARITARLQHPSIVSVHEAGVFPDGQPFYAMKLVAGESLDRVIAQTAPEARLALVPIVLAVADALAYAHAQGIVHRDLKPQNVVIGAFGETVVVDWGLAKDLTRAVPDDAPAGQGDAGGGDDRTVEGAVIGTPAYMPPEQAAGKPVDARADVYAIGAILYHALSGRAPFEASSADAILTQVMWDRPRDLAQLAPGAPEDLRTIAAKAMARDPAARYPTARELADELRRYQTGQLVASHRYSSWQLIRRFLRRNRAVVSAAAVLLAALGAFAAVSVQRIVAERNEASRQRMIADDARRVAERARAEALAHRAGAEKLADFLLVKLKERLEPLGKLALLAGIGETVVAYYDSVAGATDASDEQLGQRMAALMLLADVDSDKGQLDAAERELTIADTIARALQARHPDDPAAAYGVAKAAQRLGVLAQQRKQLDRARGQFATASNLVAALLAKTPADLGLQRAAATLARLQGEVAFAAGDLAAAFAAVDGARARLEPLAATDAASADTLFATCDLLAEIQGRRGDHRGQEATLQRGAALAAGMLARHPDDAGWLTRTGQAASALGYAYLGAGRPADALAWTLRSRDTHLALTRRDPENASWRQALALDHSDLGKAYQAVARYPEAMASYRAALAIREQLAAQDPSNVRKAINVNSSREKIAKLMIALHDLAGADRELAIIGRAADALLAAHPDVPDLARDAEIVIEEQADVATARGDVARAVALYRKDLKIAAELSARDAGNAQWLSDLVESHRKLADALRAAGDARGAVSEAREAVQVARRAAALPGNDAEDALAGALASAAEAARAARDDGAAIGFAREAVAVAERGSAAHPQDPQRELDRAELEIGLASALLRSDRGEARARAADARHRLATLRAGGPAPATLGAIEARLAALERALDH